MKERLPVDNVSSGPTVRDRQTAPGRPNRRPKKRSKPRTQDMIIEGTYYTDSEPESIKDRFLLVGLTRDVADLV